MPRLDKTPLKMKALKLRAGDIFTVSPPDAEHPTRVCIKACERGDTMVTWGWPGVDAKKFFSYMGALCDVEVIS